MGTRSLAVGGGGIQEQQRERPMLVPGSGVRTLVVLVKKHICLPHHILMALGNDDENY